MTGGGLASEVYWRSAWCDARIVIGDGKLPGVDSGDGLGGGSVDYASHSETVGGVVGGLDVHVSSAGAVSV